MSAKATERLLRRRQKAVTVRALRITAAHSVLGDLSGVGWYLGRPTAAVLLAPLAEGFQAVLTSDQRRKFLRWLAVRHTREEDRQFEREDYYDPAISDRSGGPCFRLEWSRGIRVPIAGMEERDWPKIWQALFHGPKLKLGALPPGKVEDAPSRATNLKLFEE